MRTAVRRLQANNESTEVSAICDAVLDDLSDTDLAVSGGGSFYITKDFITTVTF